MKKRYGTIAILASSSSLLFAETNALIEVKLFKDWVIKGELGFASLAIKNTGTEPILLVKNPAEFERKQFTTRPLPPNEYEDSRLEREYQRMTTIDKTEFLSLRPEETHMYEGRKFGLEETSFFSEGEMRFTVSVYLGKGVWLDSEPVILKGVVPDSIEHLATVAETIFPRDLVAVTYKNERWLYTKLGGYYPDFPLSLANKIRVEPHEARGHYKIWDGDKPIVFDLLQSLILEGPDENNVFGKWTRERKQKAEADNAEVRRKKAEQ